MENKNIQILVIEDDPQIRNFISYVLKQEKFSCTAVGTAQTGMSILVSKQMDLMILDLGLPDYDGIEVIKKIREWSEIPIIVVSARDQDKEKADVLDLGADDYLTKPFSAVELLARIRVALRHLLRMEGNHSQKEASVGELKIDFEQHLVFLEEKEIHVTPMEYNLLSLFFKNQGKVLTTGYLLKNIYGIHYGSDTRALRTLMAGLRRKIEKNPAKPCYILTEIGVGYRMKAE